MRYTKEGFIEFDITENMILEAEMIEEMTEWNTPHHEVFDGKAGRISGILGEIMFRTFRPEAVHVSRDHNTHDFEIDHGFGANKYDIKCPKGHKPPFWHEKYHCWVFERQLMHDVHWYVFAQTLFVGGKFVKGWLLGYIEKNRFIEKAHERKEGFSGKNTTFSYTKPSREIAIIELARFRMAGYEPVDWYDGVETIFEGG